MTDQPASRQSAAAERAAAPAPRSPRTAAWLYLAVAGGSMIGGTARWLIAELLHDPAGFPWATLFVNVTGSFLIGLYAGLSARDGRLLAGPRQRQFVMGGILGGYTTFSIFSLETVRLLEAGSLDMAGLNLGISIGSWLMAVWAGYALASRANRLRKRKQGTFRW